MSRNFTISSILDTSDDNSNDTKNKVDSKVVESQQQTTLASVTPAPDPLVQKFKLSPIGMLNQPIEVEDKVDEVIIVDDDSTPGLGPKRRIPKKKQPTLKPNSSGQKFNGATAGSKSHSTSTSSSSSLPKLVPKPVSSGPAQSVSPSPSVSMFQAQPEQIKSFQSSFKITPTPPSKASINSIINVDEPVTTPVAPKRKRAPPKKKGESQTKRRKEDNSSTGAGTTVINVSNETPPPPTPNSNTGTSNTTNTSNNTTTKKGKTKSKKKSPEPSTVVEAPVPILTATSTTELQTKPELQIKTETNIPSPTILETSMKPPVISLNIPLIDPTNPKPGQSSVVVNVLKLAEDKYGWSAMHPNAKSAIDIMDDAIDEDEDAADEDEDVDKEKEKDKEQDENENENEEGKNSEKEKDKGKEKEKEKEKDKDKEKEKELTEEQLVRQHEVMMARKVGKYDYEDPFIDDTELQWEEEITSTKEGFFVYWGPLVEDRNSGTASKTKKKK